MNSRLQREIRQERPFAGVEEEAFLNLQRTAAVLMQAFGAELKPLGVTPTQYNALRILRGAQPDGLPCKEVGSRLVTPVPDVTRLLDRLESRSLISRGRAVSDRRVVEVRIAQAGLDLRLSYWWAPTFWLTGHALFHIWEVLVGICGPWSLLEDFAGVTLPALLTLSLLDYARRHTDTA